MKASKDSSTNLSLVGQIVEDIKVLLLTITEAIFTDTHQQANIVAHRLARIGLSCSQVCEWYGYLPSLIIDLLFEESFVP